MKFITISLFYSLLFASCIGSKESLTNAKDKIQLNKISINNRIVTIPEGELIHFQKCFDSSDFIDKPSISQPIYSGKLIYINHIIHSCILKKAYQGDKDAINFLAKYIKVIGPSNFDFNDKYFRGRELVDALIEVSYTDACEPNNYGVTVGRNAGSALLKAIKSINNTTPSKWLRTVKYPAPKDTNVCLDGYINMYILDQLKTEIDKGNVVLKDYGEE